MVLISVTFNYNIKMLRSIVGNIRATATKTLFNKNVYRINNEVPRFDSSKDYYSILEINKDSTDSEVKHAYYRLAKAYHPDSNPGKQSKFKEINEAYSVLSDTKLRKQYNSARMFTDFSRRMGRRSRQTNYNYDEMRSMYDNLSTQEKQSINEQTVRKARKIIYFGLVMIIVLPFITRRNHQYYILDQGQLIPVEFDGGFKGGMVPPPNYNPYATQSPYPGPQGGMPHSYPPQGGMSPNYPPQNGMPPNYPPPPHYQNQAPTYQSPYNQQQQNQPYADPYSSVVQNIRHQPPPPPPYRQQSNLQPGYRGPVSPE